MTKQEVKAYGMDYVKADIRSIRKKMDMVGWTPEVIVGLARGGLIPAVILSHTYKVPMHAVDWSFRDRNVQVNSLLKEDFDGKRVLIVDDIVDSGNSILSYLNQNANDLSGATDIRVASLVYNINQPAQVDFYGTLIDRRYQKEWFVFFWEDIDQFHSF